MSDVRHSIYVVDWRGYEHFFFELNRLLRAGVVAEGYAPPFR